MTTQEPRIRVRNWTNILFLTISPIVAFVGTWYLMTYQSVPMATWILAVVLGIGSGLGITAGYHRLFSHQSYTTAWPVRLGLLLLGAAAFENDALKWCSDHRVHHQHVDKEEDPYCIKKGFWHAHIGWIFYKEIPAPSLDNVNDLKADPLLRWQHKHYVAIAIAVGFIMPTLIAALWGDPWGGFIIAGVLRTVLNQHFTFSINSFCHLAGSRPYSDLNTARDNWFFSLFTYGEGYHNYHHRFPSDYRNGIRAFHWDPTKWLIRGLAAIGLADNLRRVPEERILKARVRMADKRLAEQLQRRAQWDQRSQDLLATARTSLEEAHRQFQAARVEYRRFKSAKALHMNTRLQEMRECSEQWQAELQRHRADIKVQYKAQRKKLRADMDAAKQSFYEALQSWQDLSASLAQSAA